MTRLTHHNKQHRSYITPQPEDIDQSSPRVFAVVHRHPLSPQQGRYNAEQGCTGLTVNLRDNSDSYGIEADDRAINHSSLNASLTSLYFDIDRMSEHELSSGDGEDDGPSPESAPCTSEQQWQSSTLGVRPPVQLGSTSTSPLNTKVPSNKAVSAQLHNDRRVHGQSHASLPAEKVFPIQVGTEVFRLSGASISSDGPSYFTQFFEDQIRQNEETGGVRTLYIDRDTDTFRDIARHLQGYHVKPRDGQHFVRLFADAQFYSLPRLISQLFESEIYIQIGEQHFQIPKELFSDPGNSPNFFSLGFAVFFSTPSEVFPGLDRRGLLRPPPINPPYVPSRSAEIFQQLLHVLRGYPLHIRDDVHRDELLRDCRYFHLRGLEQRIIAHDISYNLAREKSEILLRLSDLKPSGISYSSDTADPPTSPPTAPGWVYYARPFVDEQSYELIVEIGGESTVLDLDEMRVDFHGKTKARVSSLFQVVANKMGLPSNQPLGLIMLSGGTSKRSPSPGHSALSEDKVRVRFETITDVTLDNKQLDLDWGSDKGRHMLTGAMKVTKLDGAADETIPASNDSKMTPPVSTSASKALQKTPTHNKNLRNSQELAQPDRFLSSQPPQKKRKTEAAQQKFGQWTIRSGQWRMRVEQSKNLERGKYEVVFVAVKIDAFSCELARNGRRAFLG